MQKYILSFLSRNDLYELEIVYVLHGEALNGKFANLSH